MQRGPGLVDLGSAHPSRCYQLCLFMPPPCITWKDGPKPESALWPKPLLCAQAEGYFVAMPSTLYLNPKYIQEPTGPSMRMRSTTEA